MARKTYEPNEDLEEKTCYNCDKPQPTTEFNKDRYKKDGYSGLCRTCFSEKNKARYEKDKEGWKARTKKWQQENPERYIEIRDKSRLKHKETIKLREFCGRYELSLEDGAKWLLLRFQECLICEKEGASHFDHDHDSGKPRGWLCMQCNIGLGVFQDSIEVMQKAIDYLKENGKT